MDSIKYDEEVGAFYFKIKDGRRISHTIPLGNDKFLDVDESGQAIGLEIIHEETMPVEFKEILRRTDTIEIKQEA